MFWLAAAWNYLFGWAGVDMLAGLACVAVAVLTPPAVIAFIPDLRKWAIGGAVVAFTCMGCIAYGHKHAIDFMLKQRDEALTNEAANGEKDRSDSERDVSGTSDRWLLNDDAFNRNRRERDPEHKGPVRWLAVNPFRRVE